MREERGKRRRLPPHVLSQHRSRARLRELKLKLREAKLHTVCESARCPNIIECFSRPTAAFLILGNLCSRACRFCAVAKGKPQPPDPAEPMAVAQAAAELGLQHVVVTSVTRDDLADGGARHFVETIRALRGRLPQTRVEVLVPDFQGEGEAIAEVVQAGPEVFNHNLETVARLYPQVRPGADYHRSLFVLNHAWEAAQATRRHLSLKSGLMVGLGESQEEVIATLADLARAHCEVVTIGQYLQPRRSCLPVVRFWEPAEFAALAEAGRKLGLRVVAGPLVRSSYFADQTYFAEGLDSSCQGMV